MRHLGGTGERTVRGLVWLALGCAGCLGYGLDESGVDGLEPVFVKQGEVSVQYEAEARSAEQSCSQRANHAGYTGDGFMDYGGLDSWIEWDDVEVAVGGEAELRFRYANGAARDRTAAVEVNGARAADVDFAPTGAWTAWGTASARVALRKGRNTVRVRATTGRGGPNLDHMVVLAAGPPACETTPEGCGRDAACVVAEEGGAVRLACESGETISAVRFASYGTPTGSCGEGFAQSSCHADSSVSEVEAACLGREACEVDAKNGVFGDPCVGTRKRLAVQYTCRPDALCAEAPEGRTASLACPPGERIDSVRFASYGTPTGSCGEGFAQSSCHAASSLAKVETECVGREACEVEAKNSVFGDPCVGTYKRLSVQYTCATAEEQDDCPDDPDKTEPGECGCGVPEGRCGPESALPVKVFILAGQSNMQGHGEVTPSAANLEANGGMGTLEYLVNDSPVAQEYTHLVDADGGWAERDDVWIVDLNRAGPLTVGYGARPNLIGPELQFGHVLGDFYENPVLLIKVAWGGKSLHVDFRPPSAGGEVGLYYTALVERVHEVLDNLRREMPSYRGQGYELAGFGWHQGWNDRINQEAVNNYQTNCVHLINDLRDEFDTPEMPFVIATTGMSGWTETHPRALALMEAQLAVPTDERLHAGNVVTVDTRDFWRDVDQSPSSQGYHWNRNAETYVLIGDAMGEAMVTLQPADELASIEKVYLAQTHVQEPTDPLFKLVGQREALLKVQVTAPSPVRAPAVSATLRLGPRAQTLRLTGPAILPTTFESAPGVVQHRYEDSFTARIPAGWVQPGLSVRVRAGRDEVDLGELPVGAPTKVIMTMFDVNYFKPSPGDYPAGWDRELEAKWPVSRLQVRRVPDILFEELIIPPRAGVGAARVGSREDYKAQTGLNFDGEQAAALHWKSALKDAAGTGGRVSLYYVNIYGVNAGGQAGGFGGVGNGTSIGILNHELGHALSLPHWGPVAAYPYRGEMYGIPAPGGGDGPHVGPTWAFDPPSGRFLPPTVQPGAKRGTPGEYKADPMWGGGWGDQEEGLLMRHFSDYSVNQMRNYLEGHVVVWRGSLNAFARWDDATGGYTRAMSNNGVSFPVVRDTQVISVMAGVGVGDATADPPPPNLVYPPIGPYTAGLIDLFDPGVAADRARADQVFCPSQGCDFSLRITQGGRVKTYMLPISQNPGVDPLSGGALKTRALNLPASDGEVTRVELLCTPDAEKSQPSPDQPPCPADLSVWSR